MATPSTTENATEPTNRQLAETLFTRAGPAEWRCLLCSNSVAQTARKGYTNLRSHLWLRHRDRFLAEFRRRQQPGGAPTAASPPSASDTVSHNAIRANADALAWLEWVVAENRDPAVCASPETLKLAALDPVTPPELRRCLNAAYGSLMARIADELGSNSVMGLALDVWTRPLGDKGDSNVVIAAVFAVLPPSDAADGARPDHKQRRRTMPRRSLLLGLSVSPYRSSTSSKEDAAAGALGALANRVTEAFAIDVHRRVAFLVGDPDYLSAVQEALASHNGNRAIPIISCANKQLKAAADAVASRHQVSQQGSNDVLAARAALGAALALPWAVRQRAIALSPSLMDVLSTINVSMLADDRESESSWVETLETVAKYQELHAAITTAVISQEEDEAHDGLKRLLVPDEAFARLQSLRTQLNDLASVKRKLSLRSGAPLHLVRRLFDAVRDRILGCADAIPVQSASGIDSGVVKVLQDRERSLTVAEERAMTLLLLDRGGDDNNDTEDKHEKEQEELSFADAAILEATGGGETWQTKYMDLWWVPSTAEDRELLFPTDSRGDNVLGMSPLTAEMLAMLRYNRDQWTVGALADELGVDSDGKKKRRARAKAGDGTKRRRTDPADI